MKHPLRSTGTHQTARLLRAIAPGHFRLDERSMQDLITAAHSYARMLSYVAPNGKPDGDWAAFWEVENLTYMAVLAAIDTRQLRRDYDAIDFEWGQALQEERERPLKSKKKDSAEPPSPQYLRRALCQLRDMASRLEKHYSTLREAVPLKAHILSLIRKGSAFEYVPDEVESLLQQLVGYHKGADDHLDALCYREFWQPDFRWGIRDRDEYDCILPVEDCTREQARELFVRLHNIFITLQAHAQRMFEEELARIEQPEEALERRLEPHIALFIAFLRLFRHAQDGMNDLPRRHLDFYYNSVLCLDRKPAQPDHAYLIFTLAKEFEQELVEKGTLLLAGKDKKGRLIQFETLERWKVTKASIEEIRNTAITPDYINAATVAEKGAPPAAPFRPFGDDGSAPAGELGFAIASPQLLLLEGKREVTITMELAGKIEYANIFASEVQVKYSTGEGYHDLPKLSADKEGNFNGFVLNPVVAPFEPLKTVEPARRILSELVSDEVTAAFSAAANSPSLQRILHDLQQRYTRAASNSPMNAPPDANTATWFQDNFYYPALSGIYLASTILRQNEEPTGQGATDEYQAQLYFYRAYYLWCLATICCPSPQFITSQPGSNHILQTHIPDLTALSLTPQTPPLQLSQCFVLGRMYQQILEDLLNSLKALTGKHISLPDDLSEFKSKPPASNTSINIYTVCAMISRTYMQVGQWDACLNWSQVITSSNHYQAGAPAQDDEGKEDTAKRVFESIFKEVETSPEVIWAMNAVAGNEEGGAGTSSLFSILGSHDLYGKDTETLYFEESPLLNEVNKQNLRYDDRIWQEPQPPSTGGDATGDQDAADAQSLKATSSSKPSKKKAASADGTIDPETNPYDYRDKVAYREEGSGKWFTEKYFLSPTAPYVPMIRLAEIMLNEAWCRLKLGGSGSNNAARDLLNTLRERAGALPFLKQSDTPGTDAHQVNIITAAHVEEERMRELAFEGDRRDFVRLARGIMAKRDYVVNSADPGVLVLNLQAYLPPAQKTLILTPDGVAKAPINWDSPWLHMTDMLPQPGQVDLNSIRNLELSSSLTLSLTLKEDAPAFLPDPLLLASHGVRHPVVRVTFNGADRQGKGSGFYNFLKNQTLSKATIKTTVTGIQKSLILQNDFGVFDGTQRFYPFGPIPENSARFFLGCQEAFSKKLSKVSIDFDWVEDESIAKGLKGYEDVYEHYQSLKIVLPTSLLAEALPQKFLYFSQVFSGLPNLSTTKSAKIATIQTGAAPVQAIPYPQPRVTIDLLKDADFNVNRILPEASWFVPPLKFANTTGDSLAKDKSKMRSSFDDLSVTQFDRASTSEQVAKYSPTQKRGFLKFTLIGDFGHTAYRQLVMDATSKQPNGAIPHEPYTPATNSVSLSYESTQDMKDPQLGQLRLDHFFHLLPFGGMVEAGFDGKTSLVYDYPIQPPPQATEGGYFPANLFLGMKNLVAGDNLSLLFQTQEASELLPDARPPKVHWMYLQAGSQWARIPVERILRDTTRGLTRSGIIQIATPNDLSSTGNTLLSPSLLWLRAAVLQTDAPEQVGAFPALLDIRAQAVEARFLPAEANDLNRLSEPLPAQSVSGLALSSSAIKKVEQPFESFGGRAPEVEGSPEYHRRISEHLRHKGRAVSAADYERLLLEAYPAVAIAKCIPHTRYESTEGYLEASELAPGFVSVAVVPDLSRHPNMVRTEPRFSRGDLEEMRDTLLPHTNAFVQTRENRDSGTRTDFLQVLNPRYEPVSLAVKVWLTRGTDQSWAIYQLEQVLRRFLAPWLEDPDRLPQFSRSVRRSHLIQLIEQQDFVDAIQDLIVFHLPPDGNRPAPDDHGGWKNNWTPATGSVITPSTARSILTTSQHLIEIADGVGGIGGPAPRKAEAPPSPPSGGQEETWPTAASGGRREMQAFQTAMSEAQARESSSTSAESRPATTGVKPAAPKPEGSKAKSRNPKPKNPAKP